MASDPPVSKARIRARITEGEYLLAFDLASKAMAEQPHDKELAYLAVFALAGCGSTRQAARLYDRCDLGHEADTDTLALRARLLKDEALHCEGKERIRRMLEAANAYAAVFHATGDYYPGVNAATMLTLTGDVTRAAPLIAATERACDSAAALLSDGAGENTIDRPPAVYYCEATRAELALLRGDVPIAQAALVRAMGSGFDDWSAIAATRQQLLLICRHKGISSEFLTALRLPRIIHFIGHLISPPGSEGRFPADQERDVAQRIADYIRDQDVRIGFGSLACGADILFAEAILARGCELNLVLPFNSDEFKEVSVSQGGPGWARRFDDCLAGAHSVTYANDERDDSVLSYAARLAMGLAVLRARNLGADVVQAAVWDGAPSVGTAGTAGSAAEIGYWRGCDRHTDVIPVTATGSPGADIRPPRAPATASPHLHPQREARALLFGDFHGYSKLRETGILTFQKVFMQAVADVLMPFGDAVLYRNSWGDAFYLVIDGVIPAARCALAIQAKLASLDPNLLPGPPALRLAGHFGPTIEGVDPIRNERTYFGVHVTRAARLEPVTPVNEVYVTEPFAAALMLARFTQFSCEYVGRLPSAKDYGTMRMYVLHAAQ